MMLAPDLMLKCPLTKKGGLLIGLWTTGTHWSILTGR